MTLINAGLAGQQGMNRVELMGDGGHIKKV